MEIMDAPRKAFLVPSRIGERWGIKPEYLKKYENRECAGDIYRGDTGALLLVRDQYWPRTHPPAPHNAPPREDDGNPDERVSMTGFVFPALL